MRREDNEFELAIRHEAAAHGWVTATVPALPGTISAGPTMEARTNVFDALRTMLATPPDTSRGHDTEILRVRLEPSRRHDLDRGL